MAALDVDDRFVGFIGADADIAADGDQGWPQRLGWPNSLSSEGRAEPPPGHPDRFNSPHSMAVDADGNLFVSEWLLGGRYVKVTAAQDGARTPTTTQTNEARA